MWKEGNKKMEGKVNGFLVWEGWRKYKISRVMGEFVTGGQRDEHCRTYVTNINRSTFPLASTLPRATRPVSKVTRNSYAPRSQQLMFRGVRKRRNADKEVKKERRGRRKLMRTRVKARKRKEKQSLGHKYEEFRALRRATPTSNIVLCSGREHEGKIL